MQRLGGGGATTRVNHVLKTRTTRGNHVLKDSQPSGATFLKTLRESAGDHVFKDSFETFILYYTLAYTFQCPAGLC